MPNTHTHTHTRFVLFVLDYCRFNSSDHVKRHMRTHTGEKPYKCKYCDRAFAQSNDLVKHTRSHVGDNTYQCNACSAAFRLHSELRAHSKVHFLEQKVTNTVQEASQEIQSDTATMVVITTDGDVERLPSHRDVLSTPIIGESRILYIKEEMESIAEQPVMHATNGMEQFTIPSTTTLVVPVTDTETGTILIEQIQIEL